MDNFANQLYEEANSPGCLPTSIIISEASPSGMPLTSRFVWKGKGDKASASKPSASLDKGNVRVLRPLEIRSFFITYNDQVEVS